MKKIIVFLIVVFASLDAWGQSREDAIRIQKILADNIEKSHPSNHAAMHVDIMKSRFEEVQIYASSNIHKYDRSAREEAYRASVATGNPRVIAAANESLDRVNWDGVNRSIRVNPSGAAQQQPQQPRAATPPQQQQQQQPRAAAPALTGRIENVRVEHNVTENGRSGMRINVLVSTNRTNVSVMVFANFYHSNGAHLFSNNSQFRNGEGHLQASTDVHSNRIVNRERTFSVFLPYSEINLGSGRHDLRFSVQATFSCLNIRNDRTIDTSQWHNFTLTR